MSNCEVKSGHRDGDGLEVHISNSTEIADSQSLFNVTKEKEAENAVTFIEDVEEYQRVTVEGKVVGQKRF